MLTLRLVLLAAVLGGGGCATRASESDPASVERCTELRDHLVDLRLAGTTGVDLAAHRDVLKKAMGVDFITRCTTTMLAGQVSCALASSSSADAAACTAARPHD